MGIIHPMTLLNNVINFGHQGEGGPALLAPRLCVIPMKSSNPITKNLMNKGRRSSWNMTMMWDKMHMCMYSPKIECFNFFMFANNGVQIQILLLSLPAVARNLTHKFSTACGFRSNSSSSLHELLLPLPAVARNLTPKFSTSCGFRSK